MTEKEIQLAKLLLKRSVAFHWALAMICQSVNAGLMLSQAMYWTERTDDDEGWFYKTRGDWFAELCLGKYEQLKAREILKDLEFMKEDLRGNPAKTHYQVQQINVYKALFEMAGKQPTKKAGNQPSGKQPTEGGKPDNKSAENQTTLLDGKQPTIKEQRLPEITSENTTETTGPSSGAGAPAASSFSLQASPDSFLEIWNANCGQLPKVREITKSRERKIKSRVKAKPDFGFIKDFTDAVKHAASNAFLTGDNNRGWVASFDWMIANDTNHVAVLEGKYDAKPQANSGRSNSERQGTTNGQGVRKNSGAYRRSEEHGESAERFKREADLIF
jgi:hypothetical protein